MSETHVPETDPTTKAINEVPVLVAALGDLRGLLYSPPKQPFRIVLGRNVDDSAVVSEVFGDFTLGDIGLLRTLCDKILSDVYANQSFAVPTGKDLP